MTVSDSPPSAVPRPLLARARAWLASPPLAAAAATVLAVLVAVVWLLVDRRVPGYDTGDHLGVVFGSADAIRAGHLLDPIQLYHGLPPLVYVLGAYTTLIAGVGIDPQIAMLDVVFLGLAGLGLYRAGRIVAGPVAGLVAVLGVLGAPVVISQGHEFMFDLPLTAVTALAVWLLLASDRFAHRGYSIAAGGALGLGLMTKTSFPIFVAGVVAVMLVRGGWRRPVNVALCAALAAAVAAPWYLPHWPEVAQTARAARLGSASRLTPTSARPDRFTVQNFAWYGWALVNVQLLLPFTLLFAAGLVDGVRRFVRTRAPGDHLPELVAGGAVGWIGISIASQLDIRYSMPCLVYVALIAGALVARAPGRVRRVLASVAVAAFAVNMVMVNLGAGPTLRAGLPGANGAGPYERQVTLASPEGYIVSAPARGRELELLRAARRAGARRYLVENISATDVNFNNFGWRVLGRMAGIGPAPNLDPSKLGPRDIFLIYHRPQPGDLPPCARLPDGAGMYVYRRFPLEFFDGRTPRPRGLWCPL